MPKLSKRFKKATEGLDSLKSYELPEAVKLLKERASTKFDETYARDTLRPAMAYIATAVSFSFCSS